jgi:hypothetical protein
MGFALPGADAIGAVAMMLAATMLWLAILRRVPRLRRTSAPIRAGR